MRFTEPVLKCSPCLKAFFFCSSKHFQAKPANKSFGNPQKLKLRPVYVSTFITKNFTGQIYQLILFMVKTFTDPIYFYFL